MDAERASSRTCQLLPGVSGNRTILKAAQSKNSQSGCWVLSTDFILQFQLPLCWANVDMAGDVHRGFTHFIALKVSAVHLRRREPLDPVKSFVLMGVCKTVLGLKIFSLGM